MASIPYRNNKWQARIIRKGYTPVARSFLTKLDAERWSRSIETEKDSRVTFEVLVASLGLETPALNRMGHWYII